MSDYPRLKAGVIAEIESWYAGNPTGTARKRARAAFGDPGTGPTYNTVTVDGTTFLSGSLWGFALDPAHPELGPDPESVDRGALNFLLRGLQAYLHGLKISANTSPGLTDDVNAGFDPGDRWIRLDTHRTWTLHDSTVGGALWVEDTGGGGGGGGTTINVGAASVSSTVNLSNTAPPAPANALNVLWQKNASAINDISAYILTDGATLIISGGALQVGAIPESKVTGLIGDLNTLAAAIPIVGGAVTTETAFGQGSSNGVSTAAARSDHTHGTPAAPTPAGIGAVPVTRTVTGTAPVTVNGDNAAHALSGDLVVAIIDATTAAKGVVQLEANSADTTATHVVTANDTRLSDARDPTAVAKTLLLSRALALVQGLYF